MLMFTRCWDKPDKAESVSLTSSKAGFNGIEMSCKEYNKLSKHQQWKVKAFPMAYGAYGGKGDCSHFDNGHIKAIVYTWV